MKQLSLSIILLSMLFMDSSFYTPQSSVTGAWYMKNGNIETVFTYKDGYFTHTIFSREDKKFISSTCGTYKEKKGGLMFQVECDTKEKANIGKEQAMDFTISGDKMRISENDGTRKELTRLDDGTGSLAGNWRITSRMNNGQMQAIQKSPRKTLKLLSGTRFQWIAINTETKEFFGTGGGTYTFKDNKYTENIEFFSRDSSRVGASLTFDGSVNNDVWTHKGINSRGEPLHEEWSRDRQ